VFLAVFITSIFTTYYIMFGLHAAKAKWMKDRDKRNNIEEPLYFDHKIN
jgi:hypothetical protein